MREFSADGGSGGRRQAEDRDRGKAERGEIETDERPSGV